MPSRNERAIRAAHGRRRNDRQRNNNSQCAGICFSLIGFAVYIGVRIFLIQAEEDNLNDNLSPLEIFGLCLFGVFSLFLCIEAPLANDDSNVTEPQRGYDSLPLRYDNLEGQEPRQPLLESSVDDDLVTRELERYAQARDLMEQSNGTITSFVRALQIIEEREEERGETEAPTHSIQAQGQQPEDTQHPEDVSESAPQQEQQPEETKPSTSTTTTTTTDSNTTFEYESELERYEKAKALVEESNGTLSLTRALMQLDGDSDDNDE